MSGDENEKGTVKQPDRAEVSLSADRLVVAKASPYTKQILELAGIAALLALPALALRALVIANFNPQVALALAANSGTNALLTGIAMGTIPIASFFGSLLLASWATRTFVIRRRGMAATRKVERIIRLVALAVLQVCLVAVVALPEVLLLPPSLWVGLLLLIVYGMAVWDGARLGSAAEGRVAKGRNGVRVTGINAVIIFGLFSLLGSMWLPPERVVLNDEPTTAYVLSAANNEAVIFIDDSNAVMRVPLDDLERQYCVRGGDRTIGEVWLGQVQGLPSCPK